MAGSTTESPEIGAAFAAHGVQAAGFDVRYWEAGSGTPVVWLPGAGGPAFSRALDLLAEQFRVIVIELPGWGAQPNDAADFDELAAQVAAVIEAIGPSEYHLTGTSLGAVCALHLALAHPERVISLTLESPAKFRERSLDPSTAAPEQLARAFRSHPERPPVQGPPDTELLARVWPTVERLMGNGAVDDAFLARLAQLPTRTLVLFGRDDGLIHPSNGPTYRRALPNSVLFYVYDAAHDVQGDRPEAFADVVSDFVRRGMNFLVNDEDRLINP